jgi:hypothetical protein
MHVNHSCSLQNCSQLMLFCLYFSAPPPPHHADMQVRAVADLLPEMEVVEGDPFNSSPTDPKLMGPDALARFRKGEKLPAISAKTPIVSWGSLCCCSLPIEACFLPTAEGRPLLTGTSDNQHCFIQHREAASSRSKDTNCKIISGSLLSALQPAAPCCVL